VTQSSSVRRDLISRKIEVCDSSAQRAIVATRHDCADFRSRSGVRASTTTVVIMRRSGIVVRGNERTRLREKWGNDGRKAWKENFTPFKPTNRNDVTRTSSCSNNQRMIAFVYVRMRVHIYARTYTRALFNRAVLMRGPPKYLP